MPPKIALRAATNAYETDSGRTLILQLGQTLNITLPYISWGVTDPSDQTVLHHLKTTVRQPSPKQPGGETILSYKGSAIGRSTISAMRITRPDCSNTHLTCPKFIGVDRFQLTIHVVRHKY